MQARIRKVTSGYLLILPAVLLLFSFLVYPLLHSIYMSLQKVSLASLGRQTFVGLTNYVKVFTYKGPGFFTQVLPTTFYFVAGSIVGQLFFGLAMALIGQPTLGQRERNFPRHLYPALGDQFHRHRHFLALYV